MSRVAAVIFKDGTFTLLRRQKNGEHYYVFAGGLVEEGEKLEDALRREIREELGIEITIDRLLFDLVNREQYEYYYLVTQWEGDAQLIMDGPEKTTIGSNNTYELAEIEFAELKTINLLPHEARDKVSAFTIYAHEESPSK